MIKPQIMHHRRRRQGLSVLGLCGVAEDVRAGVYVLDVERLGFTKWPICSECQLLLFAQKAEEGESR